MSIYLHVYNMASPADHVRDHQAQGFQRRKPGVSNPADPTWPAWRASRYSERARAMPTWPGWPSQTSLAGRDLASLHIAQTATARLSSLSDQEAQSA